MTTDIVITTISDGSFLKHWDGTDARLIIIPDRNTPAALYEQASARWAACPDPDEQSRFLRKLGCAEGFIPWNSDNRRNVGYLMAWADGADSMVSADDDNFPLDDKWLTGHQAGLGRYHLAASSDSGWLNVMSLLGARQYWQRGFPYFARHDAIIRGVSQRADVTINQGLWLGDPDVDAVTRLAAHPVTETFHGSCVLADDTWAPVNSQNTAVRRDVIPAYWFTRMPSWGGRWGDIFQGYFAQACAKHLGHAVRFGEPLVRQARNEHDLLSDLELEFPFYRPMEQFLEWLPETQLEGTTYRDAYESLSYALHEAAENFDGRMKGFLHQMAFQMRYWLRLCDQIGRE